MVLVSSDNSDFSAQSDIGLRNVTVNTSGTGSLTVPTINDEEDEPNGFISVLGLNGSNYLIGRPHGASVAVSDNDDPDPSVTIMAGPATTEGTTASFTVSANPAPKANLTVNLRVTDAPHSDFVTATNEGAGKTVTILADSTTATYEVATSDDKADEPNGPITVAVTDGGGGGGRR